MPGVSKATPNFVVEHVEPCVRFWEALGFACPVSVPHEDEAMGFAILVKDAVEIMYQSVRSIKADDAQMAARLRVGGGALYVDVDDLDAAVAAVVEMAGAEIVMPRRETFYGAQEVGVLDPGGNVVVLARRIG